jgi:hypothetical protein
VDEKEGDILITDKEVDPNPKSPAFKEARRRLPHSINNVGKPHIAPSPTYLAI